MRHLSNNLCALTIHIGAHRTASSSAQKSLLSLQEEGGLPGWRVFEPTQMRGRFTRAVEVSARLRPLAHPITTRLMAPEVATALRDEQIAPLLSDENVLGHADECLFGRASLYPNARRNLLAVKGLVSGSGPKPPRVVLSIRSYATWWPSAYALLGIRRDMPDIGTMVPGWMKAHRRWPDRWDERRVGIECRVSRSAIT